MVEKAAADYAKIIQSANLEREINPICVNIEDMLARLDEFETLLANVKAETSGIVDNHVSNIIGFKYGFKALRERIDNLEQFVEVVNENVGEMERVLDIAEEELNVTDYSLRGLLLKPLLAKTMGAKSNAANATQRSSNLKDGEFQAVNIFKTDDYFGVAETDEAHGTVL